LPPKSLENNFYYSGDTALTLDMKLVSETTKLKFAVLCIGGNLTMDVDDAIRATDLLQCKDIMGVHYDTFSLIKIDHAAAKEKFRSKGLTLHLLPIGGTQDFEHPFTGLWTTNTAAATGSSPRVKSRILNDDVFRFPDRPRYRPFPSVSSLRCLPPASLQGDKRLGLT
jgi:hypothetical protein